MSIPSVRVAAARRGAFERYRGADDPHTRDAVRDLAAANIEAAIQRNLAAAPPLTDEQAARLSVILSRGGKK